MNTFKCFSQKLAGYLLMNGFSLIGIKSDLKKTGRNIYLFQYSELENIINFKDVVKYILEQNTFICKNNAIGRKNWKPIKTYYEYLTMFNSVCKKLGRSITPYELEKHKFNLPSAPWLVKNHPNKNIKTYNDFLELLGLELTKKRNPKRKYTYEIAYEEFAKRGLILLPQEYKNCTVKMKYICPNHPDVIQEKSLNNLIFGNNSITKGGCFLCYSDSQIGPKSNSWKGGFSALGVYLREFIDEWKKDSMSNCNYKCIITGDKFNNIHHLYSFNKILREVMEESGLPVYTKINNYTEDELILLRLTNIKIHNKYPLGVCLRKDIHNLYHHLYGYNNTPEQFEEFKIRYDNGEFKDVV